MRVHQFWYGDTLPPGAFESAQSFYRHGHNVTLWSYRIYDLPEGVQSGDASMIWPEVVFETYCARFESKFDRHRAVAAAADYFRMHLLHHVLDRAEDNTVAWADSDTWCLKPLPSPGAQGAIFSTVPARQTGPFAPKPDAMTGRREHFSLGLMILDRRALPFVTAAMVKLASFKAHHKYTDAMNVVDRVRRKMNLTDLYPPLAFCPIPSFALKRAAQVDSCNGFYVYGTRCPALGEILQHSFVVHFYGSHGYHATLNYPTSSLLRSVLG
jgi:hypothetical protein